MRQIVLGLVIALGAACAPSRRTTASAVPVVKAPPPVTDDASVEGSTFAEDEIVFSPPIEERADPRERAKQLFRDGTIAFQRGDFAAAIVAFTEADAIAPMAALVFNIATVREKMGDLGGARSTYATVLSRPGVDEGLRVAALEAIARIDRVLAGVPAPPK